MTIVQAKVELFNRIERMCHAAMGCKMDEFKVAADAMYDQVDVLIETVRDDCVPKVLSA